MQRCLDESFSPFVSLVNLFNLFFRTRSLIDHQYCYDITLLADWILISSRAGIHNDIDLSMLSDTLYHQIVIIQAVISLII